MTTNETSGAHSKLPSSSGQTFKTIYCIGKTFIKEDGNDGMKSRTPLSQDRFNTNSKYNDSCVSTAGTLSPPGKLSDYVNHLTNIENVEFMRMCTTNNDNEQADNNPLSSAKIDTPSSASGKPVKKNKPLHWSLIQKDLSSPSAFLRMRAIRAINNSQESNYTPFDVPADEQSLHIPYIEPPSMSEVMRNIVVYVDVRSGEDNRSAGVRKVIENLGAKVNSKLSKGTTHVIFKDGLLSTYKKAKQLSIPIVSILWIEACKNERRICDTDDYPISNIDRYENPELYSKIKRVKFMQPDSENNKRIRNKTNVTPNRKKISSAVSPMKKTESTEKHSALLNDVPNTTVTNQNKLNISHYHKKLHDKSLIESPATQLLNKIEAEAADTDEKNNVNYYELNSSQNIRKVLRFSGQDDQDQEHCDQWHEVDKIANRFDNGKKTMSINPTDIGTPNDKFIDVNVTTDSLKNMSISSATEIFRKEKLNPTKILQTNRKSTINKTQIESLNNYSSPNTVQPKTISTSTPCNGSEILIENDINKKSRLQRRTTYSLQEMDESQLKGNSLIAKSISPLKNPKMKKRQTISLRETNSTSLSQTHKDDLIKNQSNTRVSILKRRTLHTVQSIDINETEKQNSNKKEKAERKDTPKKNINKPSTLITPNKTLNKINEEKKHEDKAAGCIVDDVATSVKSVTTSKTRKRRTLYTPQNMDLEESAQTYTTPIALSGNSQSTDIYTISANISKICPTLSNVNDMSEERQQKISPTTLSPIKSQPLFEKVMAEKADLNVVNIDEISTNPTTPLVFNSTRRPINKRRTLFDVSIDIITQRIQCINHTTTNRRSIVYTSLDFNTPTNNNNNRTNTRNGNNIISPSIFMSETQDDTKRKRKLFAPNVGNSSANDTVKVASSQSSKEHVTGAESPITSVSPRDKTFSNTIAIKGISPPAPMMRQSSAIQKDQDNSTKTTSKTRRSTLYFEFSQKNETLDNKKSNNNDKNKVSRKSNSSNSDNNTRNNSENNINERNAKGVSKQTLPVLSYTNMGKNEVDVIRQVVNTIGGFSLSGTVSKESSHVITSNGRRTLNLLRALIRGLWILRYDWILESKKAGYWLAEEAYELENFSRAIKICRSERQAFGKKYKSELFNNFEPFYITTNCNPLTCQNARELITLCGGKIAKSPTNARYIIGDWESCHQFVSAKLCITPYWILDCITQMQILNINKYICKP